MSTKTTAKTETPEEQVDLEAIVPEEFRITVNGIDCRVKRLKTKEFLSLMRVLTKGIGAGLGDVSLDFTDGETVARDLSALMLLALPGATEEFTLFLSGIVEPVDPEKTIEVNRYLYDNPEVEDLLNVFEAVATQERHDLAGLAGKAQAMWKRVGPMYQGAAKKKTG